jgi:hypothetical protein
VKERNEKLKTGKSKEGKKRNSGRKKYKNRKEHTH